jgi:hypothetical protein
MGSRINTTRESGHDKFVLIRSTVTAVHEHVHVKVYVDVILDADVDGIYLFDHWDN